MNKKQFSERLNKELDNIGVPTKYDDRVKAVAKIFHINQVRAKNILEGHYLKEENLLHHIADELDISVDLLVPKEKEEGDRKQ